MKKILAVFLAIILCAGLVACGEATTNEKLNDFIKAGESDLNTLKEAYKDTCEVDVYAEKDSIVYRYQYIIDVGDRDEAKKSLESGFNAQTETINQTIETIRLTIPELDSLIVEYYDKEGKLLAKREYR